MAKKKETKQRKEEKNIVATAPVTLSTRGRTFEGFVTKKFPTRVVIEFERTVYVKKYRGFYKKKTRLHARLPPEIEVVVGDYIEIRECRPLSKIIHFIVIKKIRSAQIVGEKQ